MNETLTVRLVEIELIPAMPDLTGHDFNVLLITLLMMNSSYQEVQAVEGRFLAWNIFGDEIAEINIRSDRTVPARGSKEVLISIEFNPQSARNQAFVRTNWESARVIWIPERMLTRDGKRYECDFDVMSENWMPVILENPVTFIDASQ